MAQAFAPPRRDGVEAHPAIGEGEPASACGHHLDRREFLGIAQMRAGMPDHRVVAFGERRRGAGFRRGHGGKRGGKRARSRPGCPASCLSITQVMVARAAVVTPAAQAAVTETTSANRRGRDRCGRVSRSGLFQPRTRRSPRLTRVSDGKPRRRLDIGVKAGAVVVVVICCVVGHGIFLGHYK